MANELKRACAFLEVDPAQVVSSRIDKDAGLVIMVVDMGIKGSPKLSVPISDLPKTARKAPAKKKEEEPPKDENPPEDPPPSEDS